MSRTFRPSGNRLDRSSRSTFGNKRVIAFYEPANGYCAVNAVVYDKTDADSGMTTAARVRVSLNPRQVVHIDSTDNKSINLQCGDRAEMLALVDNDELCLWRAASEPTHEGKCIGLLSADNLAICHLVPALLLFSLRRGFFRCKLQLSELDYCQTNVC
ncbi:hypothetical protein [Methyloceanibacter sp.]|uniref:hypothetical protein n=1 Tax=Methyloceanibacter sp. TaxID=1965321 RepID=UPI003C7959F1